MTCAKLAALCAKGIFPMVRVASTSARKTLSRAGNHPKRFFGLDKRLRLVTNVAGFRVPPIPRPAGRKLMCYEKSRMGARFVPMGVYRYRLPIGLVTREGRYGAMRSSDRQNGIRTGGRGRP